MRTRIGTFVTLGLCLLAGCGGGSGSATNSSRSVTITDLGIPDIGEDLGYTSASKVNDLGQVTGPPGGIGCGANAGPGCGVPPSFLYRNGVVIDISSKLVVALDINNKGQIVGDMLNKDGLSHAALLDSGNLIDLGVTSPGSAQGSSASALNDAGQVVGFAGTSSGATHPFLWQNGKKADLGSLSPHTGSNDISGATAINNKGQVAGIYNTADFHFRAFLWQNGKMTDIGTLGGSGDTRAIAINDWGQIIGTSPAIVNGHPALDAFLWQNGRMTDIYAPAGLAFTPTDINNAAQIVGYARTATSGIFHAFLWQNGKLTDLNSLLSANSGWILNVASAINNRGQICGSGTHNRQYHLFLLIPSINLP